MYNRVTREAGGQGWWTDYPNADTNFSIRLSELTKTRISRGPAGEPNHLVVRPTDDELLPVPVHHRLRCGHGRLHRRRGPAPARLPPERRISSGLTISGARRAWEQWSSEIGRVLPSFEYPIVDLTPAHPMFRTMFELKAIPQIPNIGHWRRSGGGTSERGFDSEHVNVRGISDANGRLMVLMTHNTDIADAWEREGEDPGFFYQFSPDGYAVGINVLLYAFTH